MKMRKEKYPVLLLVLLVFFGLGINFGYSQSLPQTTSTDTGFQVGFYPSDLAIGIVSFDAAYSFKNKHTIGIAAGAAFEMYFDDEPLFAEMNNGWHLRPYHKVFLNPTSSGSISYIRHGPRFSWYNYSYKSPEWVSFSSDGLPVLRYDTVLRKETASMVGYDFIIGMENRFGIFYTDIFGGLGVRQILNFDNLAIKPSEENQDVTQVSHYDGVNLIVGLRIGIYLN